MSRHSPFELIQFGFDDPAEAKACADFMEPIITRLRDAKRTDALHPILMARCLLWCVASFIANAPPPPARAMVADNFIDELKRSIERANAVVNTPHPLSPVKN